MRTIGIITTSVIVLVVLVGVVVGIRSVPDIKRYLHIRSM